MPRSKAADIGLMHFAPDSIHLGWLAGSLGFQLRIAQEAAYQAFARLCGDMEAPPWRFPVLALIDANPGITPSVLSRATNRDKSSLTPVLRDLTSRKLIRKSAMKADRRSFGLNLTAHGRRVLHQMQTIAATHERELDGILGPERREHFIRDLKKISAGLTAAALPVKPLSSS